jgi:hypothetical protein
MALLAGSAPAGQIAAPSASPAIAPAASVASAPTQIAPPSPPTAPVCCRVAANTPILVQLSETVSSETAKRGDTFALSLAEPIVVDGATLIPAGAVGGGEVIDASPAGVGGKPGKLVLAARYINYEGVRVPLRAFRLGGSGQNNATVALVVDIAVGPVGFFIPGGNIKYPAGLKAVAKVVADVSLTPAAQASPQPEGQASITPAQRPTP